MTVRASAAALLAAGLLVLGVAEGRAQLASPSARALGLGDNYTAAARGFASLAWNPAGLAMGGNPAASFTLVPTRAIAGLDPVTFWDLGEYSDEFVPASVRSEWLRSIREEGSQEGSTGLDVTALAISVGPVAFQVSSAARITMRLAPDAAELIFFGNAGESGTPRDLDLAGSGVDAFATTTAAVGFAHAFPLLVGVTGARLSVGVTGKYTVGHLLLSGRCDVCTLNDDPLEARVNFSVIQSDSTFDLAKTDAAHGFGLDLGVGLELGFWTFGASLQNVINTFEWDADNLFVRPGEIFFGQGEGGSDVNSDFDPQPIGNASASVKARATAVLDSLKYKPILNLGAMVRLTDRITVTGDLRQQLATGIELGPRRHVGVGAELRFIPGIPLRAGVAAISGGFQFSGGLGLELGTFKLNFGGGQRNSDLGTDTIGMFALSFGAR